MNSNESPLPANFPLAQQALADIAAIDYFFAKEVYHAIILPRQAEFTAPELDVLVHSFIALSFYLRAGHSCLPLSTIANGTWGVAVDAQGHCSHQGFSFPELNELSTLLDKLSISASADQLVVFSQAKLYMRRYFQFEQQLRAYINQRLTITDELDINVVQQCVAELFPDDVAKVSPSQPTAIDWQKIAVANAINKRFSVIAGGPGTGKTYTVTKLLAALISLENRKQLASKPNSNSQLEIALVAPTGKAAQRLSESIINAVKGFSGTIDAQVLAKIPTTAQTIHRLLGVIPNSPNFRHHQHNQLSCDLLLIDEVSMVDLAMMTRIFRALKPSAKVILLGDADQLPSVAVGSVLADIAPRPHQGFSASNYAYLSQVCNVDEHSLTSAFSHTEAAATDYLSLLIKSRRFDGEGGIGKLANSVINGDVSASWQLLTANSGTSHLSQSQLSYVEGELASWLLPLVKQYYLGISGCETVEQAFTLLSKFRVLCATRQGKYGVDAINEWITQAILSPSARQLSAGQLSAGNQCELYHGMPIMISENNYLLNLFNGDIGILWKSKNHDNNSQLLAYFEQTSSEEAQTFKSILPSRLPKFTPVYAMTIHKTQGSEFEHVAMVLPKNSNNQLLSRELLYTGITRAKCLLTIASSQSSWQQGVAKAVVRHSGLQLDS